MIRACAIIFGLASIFTMSVKAQLAVTVLPPTTTAQKVVVELKIKNNLDDRVGAARAACFLLDGEGKMIGQSTKWVIGKSGLGPKGETTFNFVINMHEQSTATNLTAKVIFSRVILASGQIADIKHEVIVTAAAK